MATPSSSVAIPAARRNSFFSSSLAVVCAIALADLLLHIYFNNRYGYFRDEFDYMSCGDHLQWGYVDQPPLIPFLTHIFRALLGDSLRAIRFLPALATSFLVVQTALIARELGGRRYALVLSALCIVIAGMYLSNGSLLGTNCLEPNLWMGCAYFAVLAIKRNDPRYWLWFGVIAGLGMEEKYSIAVFGLGMVVGLLLTPQRRAFFSRWIWLGGLAAFLIFLPNLLWNMHYDWPFVQLMHNIRSAGRDVVYGPVQFFLQQVMILNPINALVWITGLIAFFATPQLRPYRALGWCYLVSYAVFFVLHGKNYYLSPVYPMLLAAGAVQIETLVDKLKSESARRSWRRSIVITVLIGGAVGLPMSVPVLSPANFVKYMQFNHVQLAKTEHFRDVSPLPQWYSDQFGWKEIADEAVVAWNRIPADERKDCGIFAQDYGQAGAIDFFDRKLGLPPALSGDRTYWLWGPRGYSGQCMIVLGDRSERLQQLFSSVEYVGRSAGNPWALEQQIGFHLCRGARFGTLADLWPQLKRWR
ncbi:MAG TPA: glycosyltransferase family 39 protein [Verrucomicrobiae bacterium]|nr:glycosyltransferase family 39 protein [Verrucomicrobiae bacterium]